MSLSAFLKDESTGSWAEQTNDIPIAHQELPSGEASRYGGGGSSRFGGGRDDYNDRPPRAGAGGFESRPHRQSDREFENSRSFRREPNPVPNSPPYVAYFGNLENSVVEADVQELLSGLQVANIRLIKDEEGAFKGFGYVEFKTADALVSALKLSGQTHHGRQIRVDVAESRKNDGPSRGGFVDREYEAKFAGDWRRDKPAAPAAVREQFRGGRSEDRPHRRDDGPRESSVDDAKFSGEWRRDKPAAPTAVREQFRSARTEDRPHRRDDGPREFRERSVEDAKLGGVWRRDTPAAPQAVRDPVPGVRRETGDRPSFKPRDDATLRERPVEDPKFGGAWRRDTPAAPQAVHEPPVVRRESGDRPPRKEGAFVPKTDRPPRQEKEDADKDFGAWRRGDVKKEPTSGFEASKPRDSKPRPAVTKKPVEEKKLLETQGK